MVFVRLSRCNVFCKECDTPYALGKGTEMSIEDIIKEVQKYPTKCICITGGEPLLQHNELAQLIGKLFVQDYTIEAETNGVLTPKRHPSMNFVKLWTVSPKLSGMKPKKGLVTHYGYYAKKKNSVFKFVIGSEKDLNEALQVMEKYYIPKEKVIFMPLGVDDGTLKKVSLWLVEECKKRNIRFSPRLQVWLWDKKKGV